MIRSVVGGYKFRTPPNILCKHSMVGKRLSVSVVLCEQEEKGAAVDHVQWSNHVCHSSVWLP